MCFCEVDSSCQSNDLGNVSREVTEKENTGTGERRFDSTSLDLREKWIGGLLCAGHLPRNDELSWVKTE